MIEVGGFDEKIQRGIDSDLFRSLIVKRKYDVHFMPEITATIYEFGDDRMTNVKGWKYAHVSLKMNLYRFWKYKAAYAKHPTVVFRRVKKLMLLYYRVYKQNQAYVKKKRINILVKTGSFTNKGDLLMFLAIVKRMKASARICVLPNKLSFYHIIKNGLFLAIENTELKSELPRRQISFKKKVASIISSKAPSLILKFFRMVPFQKVDLLLDASGYAYGDTWGSGKTEKALRLFLSLKSAKKIIMPQSLGPFTEDDTKLGFQKLAEASEVIYARDSVSYENAKQVIPNHPNLKQAPDFTFDLEPIRPNNPLLPKHFVSIIPNHRLTMPEHGGENKAYINFLAFCFKKVEAAGHSAILITHDTKHDIETAKSLENVLGKKIVILSYGDVRHIRWIILHSTFVISSRFHGLINALTQDVPVIGMGWTHKFKCLMTEYGCERYLVNLGDSEQKIGELISEMFNESKRNELISTISTMKVQQQAVSEQMWKEIERLVSQNSTNQK